MFWPGKRLTDLQMANRCFVAKDYTKALRLYVRHAETCPAEAALAYAGAAECCLRSNIIDEPIPILPGITLISEGDLRSAEHYFRLALRADPQNTKSLSGLSELLPKSSIERRELLERLVALQPGTRSLIALGDYCRSQLNDIERAYSLYRSAQEHAPRDQTAYIRLSEICQLLGRSDEANEWNRRWNDAYASKRCVDGNNLQ
jgi:tetratricopeptide (TPR) repeat protein